MLRVRSSLSLPWAIALSATQFGFIAPNEKPLETNRSLNDSSVSGPKLGKRVVRPDLLAEERGFVSTDKSIKRDAKSLQPRVLTGGKLGAKTFVPLDLSVMSEAEKREYFEERAREAIETAGLDVQNTDLRLIEDSVLIDGDVQFLKFQVYEKEAPVEDATVDVRFKKGVLVQIINHSFVEAVRSTEKNGDEKSNQDLAQIASRQLLSQESVFLRDLYRIKDTKEGYEKVKVGEFLVKDQMGLEYKVQVERSSGVIHEIQPKNVNAVEGVVQGDVYPRYYQDAAIRSPFKEINLKTGSRTQVESTPEGVFEVTEGVTPSLDGLGGRYVRIAPSTGGKLQVTGTLENQSWSVVYAKAPQSDLNDKKMAQAMVYHHTDKMVRYAKEYISTPWLNRSLTANVNLAQSCNAHWDGQTINLYSGGQGCANTGLIADVIYHEWGHGLDDNTGGISDGAYSEGFGDIMSLIITRSPILGIGFRADGGPVRNLEPNKIYPRDRGEVHAEGLIIGSTFYDLFKGLQEVYTEDQAVDLLSKYAFKSIFTASRYTDVYDALLVIDDDDTDLSNGTPHSCIINEAFALHGLATRDSGCILVSTASVSLGEQGTEVLLPGKATPLFVDAQNNGQSELTDLNVAVSTSLPEGVTIENPALKFPAIPGLGTARSTSSAMIQVAADTACGTRIPLSLAFEKGGRKQLLQKTLFVGQQLGVPADYALTAQNIRIPDLNSIKVDFAPVGEPWLDNTLIYEVRLSFTVDHSYLGDVKVSLKDPSGKTKTVYTGAGGAGVVNFDENVTEEFIGSLGKGTWTLVAEDIGRRDVGKLVRASLKLTPNLFSCAR